MSRHHRSYPDRRLAFFAHERGDARVVKRIAALHDHGWRVIGFTFHRVRDKAEVPPAWENVHLGTTFNRRYFQRLWAFGKSIGRLWSHRRRLAECRAIYVVNTDNAVLALIARRFARRPIPLVLELADIQPAMVGGGVVSRVLRAIERAVLDRTDLLVTTSPGFVREYFQPVQNFRGNIFLLENKVYPGSRLPAATAASTPAEGGRPWVVGCFGALRCRRSMEILHALAVRLGPRIRIVLRGYPAGTIADEFDALLGDLPNLTFGGSYFYPDELAGMYREIDFNWAFDMADPNGNSAWLLPNRIYEGGAFGVPALAAEATETGRWVERNRLGWTFAEPLEESLATFFAELTLADWQTVKSRCAAHPRSDFTGDADYAELSNRTAGL